MNFRFIFLALTLLGIVASSSVRALTTDRDQPATIDADEIDWDFNSGTRIYRGNVIVQQGTLHIEADELTVYVKDDVLEKAIAIGSPAIFRQRPDDKDTDVIGHGNHMELDEINNIMTLKHNASVTQAGQTLVGDEIVYNMTTDKMTMRGGAQQQPEQPATTPAAANNANASNITTSPSGRPRIVLPPRKQKNAL